MKYTVKRVFALIIALLLSLPSVCAEPVDLDGGIVIADEAPDISDGLDLVLDGDGFTVEDLDSLLSDGANGLALDGLVTNFEDDADASAPFEQTVKAGDIAFTVTAGGGVFPGDASLRVSDILDETLSGAAIDAAEKMLPGGVKQHRLYQIEVIDRDGNICPMNGEVALPSVRVEGLDLGEATRVVFYDPAEKQGREIEIVKEEEKVLRFGFAGSGVYDVVEIADDTSDGETADDTNTDGQKPSPGGEGAEQSEADEVSTDSQPTDETDEGETEDNTSSADDQSDEQTSDEVPSSGDTPDSADGDAADDADADSPQKPSPVGEGGAAQSAVTDEVPSSDDTSDSADSDAADDADADGSQKPSPVGEGGAAQSAVTDEVSSSDDTSDSADGDAADDADADSLQQPSPATEGSDSGEGAPTGAEEVGPSDDTPDNDEGEEETTSSVSPDGELASPRGEALETEDSDTSDDTSTTPADGDTTDEQSTNDQITDETTDDKTEEEVPSSDDTSTPDESTATTDGDTSDDTSDNADGDTSDDTSTTPTDGDAADELSPDDQPDPFAGDPDETDTPDESAVAPVPFDQTVTVNGVAVTVRAPAGAFPANAVLSVKRVPSYKVKQADAAIDEIRDEDQNVAVSYTFDIKVIDPDTKAELQPAEGYSVEVSFAMSEANDENLEASVYHITGENGAMTAEKLDTGVDESAEAVTATSDGFSIYTVEFTYPDLEYLMQGGGSAALSEILSALDLTGDPTDAASSDENLLRVTESNGAWTVTSLGVFAGALTLTVTISCVDYPIAVTCYQKNLYYRDAKGAVRKLEAWTPMGDSREWGEEGKETWLALTGNITFDDRVIVHGRVNLILCDDCELNAKQVTVSDNNALTIYGGALGARHIEDSGKLTVNADGVNSIISPRGSELMAIPSTMVMTAGPSPSTAVRSRLKAA